MRIQIKRNVCINKLHDKREVQLVYIAIKLPVLVALFLSYSYVNTHNVSLIRQFFPTGTVIVTISYTMFASLLETATLDDINTFTHYRCSHAANIFASLYIISNKPYPFFITVSYDLRYVQWLMLFPRQSSARICRKINKYFEIESVLLQRDA
jgi:hypothetical protein